MSKGDFSELNKHHRNGTETVMVVWTWKCDNCPVLLYSYPSFQDQGVPRGGARPFRAGFAWAYTRMGWGITGGSKQLNLMDVEGPLCLRPFVDIAGDFLKHDNRTFFNHPSSDRWPNSIISRAMSSGLHQTHCHEEPIPELTEPGLFSHRELPTVSSTALCSLDGQVYIISYFTSGGSVVFLIQQ